MNILSKGTYVRQVINGVKINNPIYEVIDYDSDTKTYQVELIEQIEKQPDYVSEHLIRGDVSFISTGIFSTFKADFIEPFDDFM
jgi:hypothetical protein